jgi:hypothetical protein
MAESTKSADPSGVDKGLIAMFIKMSPEDRLRATITRFVQFWS